MAPSGRPTEPGRADGAERARLARRARLLSWASLAWLGVEGGLGIAAGALASSVALVAFGLDSGIEALASVIVIWRFAASRTASETAERRAQRVVALSFYLLAPYVAAEALLALVAGAHPATSWPGLAVAAGSLAICPWLGAAKRRVGERLGSEATKGEGRQNQLCALLAAGVLVGLGANAALGLWWLDPAVALGIAAACLLEGRRSWRGEECGCGSCVAALDGSDDAARHPPVAVLDQGRFEGTHATPPASAGQAAARQPGPVPLGVGTSPPEATLVGRLARSRDHAAKRRLPGLATRFRRVRRRCRTT